MSRRSQVTKKVRKKKKKKIRVERLIIVILLALVVFLGIGKSVVWVGQALSNIEKTDNKKEEVSNQQKENKEGNEKDKHFDLTEEQEKAIEKKYTILVDPGHGGNDKGTQSKDGKVLEKDVSLEISKLVASKLSHQQDIQVLISRNEDKYMSLKERADYANSQDADLFISIHMNAESRGNTASGVETYYKQGSMDGSDKLAETIQKSINSYVDIKDRGIREDSFKVLTEPNMPSALIECGFLTNPNETKKLLTKEYQDNLAEGIVQGILSYLDSKEIK